MGITSWFWGPPSKPATPPSPPPELAPPPPPPPAAIEPSTPAPTRLPESIRLRKQITFLLSGSVFLLLSMGLTRRALHRRYKSVIPSYYTPNTSSSAPVSGALDALEALNLATVNVAAFGMFAVGAGMFMLDVSNIEELQEKMRASADVQALEKEAEEEFEEWIVGVLARKEKKEEVRRRVLEELEREKGKDRGFISES
ncbi:hypothetical protein RUND412_001606 [Rhizina undulata]